MQCKDISMVIVLKTADVVFGDAIQGISKDLEQKIRDEAKVNLIDLTNLDLVSEEEEQRILLHCLQSMGFSVHRGC
jgi:BMFP domain-containing protein YqiC